MQGVVEALPHLVDILNIHDGRSSRTTLCIHTLHQTKIIPRLKMYSLWVFVGTRFGSQGAVALPEHVRDNIH